MNNNLKRIRIQNKNQSRKKNHNPQIKIRMILLLMEQLESKKIKQKKEKSNRKWVEMAEPRKKEDIRNRKINSKDLTMWTMSMLGVARLRFS